MVVFFVTKITMVPVCFVCCGNSKCAVVHVCDWVPSNVRLAGCFVCTGRRECVTEYQASLEQSISWIVVEVESV